MNRRRLFIVIATLLMVIGCSRFDMTGYEDTRKGFSINLPKKWEIKRDYMGADVAALDPQGSGIMQFRPNVTVISESMPAALRPHDYYRLQFKSIQSLTDRIRNFHLQENRFVMIGGVQGKRLIYGYSVGELRVMVISCSVIHNGTGYVITGTTTYENFNTFKDTFLRVYKSFRFR
ncbi:MAG: hypothetical protein JXA20_10405 [Spirochaetes bacterium]|nr:hypothetical protein [Spirochaetota bacterium]